MVSRKSENARRNGSPLSPARSTIGSNNENTAPVGGREAEKSESVEKILHLQLTELMEMLAEWQQDNETVDDIRLKVFFCFCRKAVLTCCDLTIYGISFLQLFSSVKIFWSHPWLQCFLNKHICRAVPIKCNKSFYVQILVQRCPNFLFPSLW